MQIANFCILGKSLQYGPPFPLTGGLAIRLYSILVLLLVFGDLPNLFATPVRLEAAAQSRLSQPDQITLIYSEPVSELTAEVPSNYTLTTTSATAIPVAVQSAVLDDAATNVVRLVVSPPLTPGGTYKLTSNIAAASGLPLAPEQSTATLRGTSVQHEAQYILQCQLNGGPFSTNLFIGYPWQPNDGVRIVPYFNCIASLGLLSAHRMEPNPDYLLAVEGYLRWHASRLPLDGGLISDYGNTYSNYSSLNVRDSTDAYAALYLILLREYLQFHPTSTTLLSELWDSVPTSVAAMDLTRSPTTGLTGAKPDYMIYFAMDNCEVLRGYDAAADLASAFGWSTTATVWRSQSEETRSAVLSRMYFDDPISPRYLTHDGDTTRSWQNYYPDAQANEFVLYYALGPGNERFNQVWANARRQFFANNVPVQSMEGMAGLVALQATDSLAAHLANVRAQQTRNNTNWAHHGAWLLLLEEAFQQSPVPVSLTTWSAE